MSYLRSEEVQRLIDGSQECRPALGHQQNAIEQGKDFRRGLVDCADDRLAALGQILQNLFRKGP